MVCNVFINDLVIDDAIVIPLSIIQKDGDSNFIFVAAREQNDVIAKKRYVKIGITYKDKVQIIDGLNFGDLVITDGAFDVSDGQKLIAQINK
jgi:multidrug efflux pump subunit AcrA (membrane-fusion protein)